jgi:hypothetical protein
MSRILHIPGFKDEAGICCLVSFRIPHRKTGKAKAVPQTFQRRKINRIAIIRQVCK